MGVLIYEPPERPDDIMVAFAETALVPDDFIPLDRLTSEQLVEVVRAFRDALRRSHERSRAESESISAALGRIAETLRG
jgi:hypothetical protein